MCGIGGIYSLSNAPIDPFQIARMGENQAHRGPDDAGSVLLAPLARDGPRWWEFSAKDLTRSLPDLHTRSLHQSRLPSQHFRLGLTHRRLAIVDLTMAAHQPMANDAKTVWLTYNGELYNAPELRRSLVEKGHRFFSTSDTEVVLRLYEEMGPSCLELLNGMFAFAVWDDRDRTLVLARDRYGIKPLYYVQWDDQLAFASEVKALLALPGMPRAIAPSALVDYFTFQNTYGAQTLFQGISLLEPGTLLCVRDGRLEHRRYWDFDFTPDPSLKEPASTSRLMEVLEDTIKRQLMSDVPVGAYLSGGMDSASITALAATHVPRLMTFTGGFDLTNVSGFEAAFDERKDAEVLSALFKTEHYQMVFHAGDLEWALPRVIWAIEDLRVGMCYPYYYTARLAGRFVKVVLAGTGGDEIFAGYPWRYKVVSQLTEFEDFLRAYFAYWCRLITPHDRSQFFTPELLRAAGQHDPYASFAAAAEGARPLTDPLRRALYVEAKTFLHGLLVVEDKLSMAHSLESRVPLLDHAVVDFVTKLPTACLINHQWEKNPQGDENLAGKYLFRRTMERVLPEHILLKRKQGFSAPDQSWYQGPLMSYIRAILLDRKTLSRGYFQERYIRRVLDEHLSGQRNHRLLIWSLLSFEFWNRLFIDSYGVLAFGERSRMAASQADPMRTEAVVSAHD